jgi:hypothetical protein
MQVKLDGWAMECRINAEDPFRGFLPSTGRLVKFMPPPEVPGAVRVDTGVAEGGEISMYYDSMIAKLIVHAGTRDAAIARMRDALEPFRDSWRLVQHRLPGRAHAAPALCFWPLQHRPDCRGIPTRALTQPMCRMTTPPCWSRLPPP